MANPVLYYLLKEGRLDNPPDSRLPSSCNASRFGAAFMSLPDKATIESAGCRRVLFARLGFIAIPAIDSSTVLNVFRVTRKYHEANPETVNSAARPSVAPASAGLWTLCKAGCHSQPTPRVASRFRAHGALLLISGTPFAYPEPVVHAAPVRQGLRVLNGSAPSHQVP